jgi:hypothetical protein
MRKCAYCTHSEGTEFVASYMEPSGTITGDHFVCLPCLPVAEKWRNWFPSTKAEVANGVCLKCEGNGKYFYAGGAVGICYECNGIGKVK